MSQVCLENICVPRTELNQRLKKYISDDDLINYFGQDFQRKIVRYSELSKYQTIEQLLPTNESFIIILIEWAPYTGHWVLLSRYITEGEDTIEYFNSYGDNPSYEIRNMEESKRQELGQGILYLNNLLNKALNKYCIIYNKFQFQSEKAHIGTCGRHCIFRAIMMRDFDLDLHEYVEFMEKLKKKTKLTYDEIVAIFIK